MNRRIVVTVSADGTISAESTGRPGPSCLDDVTLMQQLCRQAEVVDSRLTREYYASRTVTDTTVVQQEDLA
ncbi:DUF2997 domain-containing protein [Nocardia sp. 004]|uniref:DUF2997 domain-containing protein n=1 Tax=Nocardia sp. 004 TaxID=3385978 RepID=UPI0039A10D8D